MNREAMKRYELEVVAVVGPVVWVPAMVAASLVITAVWRLLGFC